MKQRCESGLEKGVITEGVFSLEKSLESLESGLSWKTPVPKGPLVLNPSEADAAHLLVMDIRDADTNNGRRKASLSTGCLRGRDADQFLKHICMLPRHLVQGKPPMHAQGVFVDLLTENEKIYPPKIVATWNFY